MKLFTIFLFVSCVLATTQIDLALVLDTSGSINAAEYKEENAFAKEIINELGNDIGPLKSKVSIIEYSDGAHIIADFDACDTKNCVLKKLDKQRTSSGGTNTARGISEATKVPGLRGYLPYQKVMVLVTDGFSNSPTETELNAKKAHSDGWIVFAVGVGNEVRESELEAIASEPKENHVFRAHQWSELSEYVKDISKLFTQISKPKKIDLKLMSNQVDVHNNVSCHIGYKDIVYLTTEKYREERSNEINTLKWQIQVRDIDAEGSEYNFRKPLRDNDMRIKVANERSFLVHSLDPLRTYQICIVPLGVWAKKEDTHCVNVKTTSPYDEGVVHRTDIEKMKEEICSPDFNLKILLFGDPSVGKSELINIISTICLPDDDPPQTVAAVAEDDQTTTRKVKRYRMTANGEKRLRFYDSPGIENETEDDGGCWNFDKLEDIIEYRLKPFHIDQDCATVEKRFKTEERTPEKKFHAGILVVDAFSLPLKKSGLKEKYKHFLRKCRSGLDERFPIIIVGTFVKQLLKLSETEKIDTDIYARQEVTDFRQTCRTTFGENESLVFVAQSYPKESKRDLKQEGLVIQALHKAYGLGKQRYNNLKYDDEDED